MYRSPIPLLLAAVLIVGGIVMLRSLAVHSRPTAEQAARAGSVGCSEVARAFRQRRSPAWLTARAVVTRVLPDEHGRAVHQRLILECPGGLTIQVDNNVTVGERVPVRRGQTVVIHGQYVWTESGGLIHFTHQATEAGGSGWILFKGRLYAFQARPPDVSVVSSRSLRET